MKKPFAVVGNERYYLIRGRLVKDEGGRRKKITDPIEEATRLRDMAAAHQARRANNPALRIIYLELAQVHAALQIERMFTPNRAG
jgi:hypothetical protein